MGPALVGALPSPGHGQVGLVASQHDRGEMKGDDGAAHHQAALTLSQTVTADLTASTTFRLTGFSVVIGNLVATGTIAGQPVTANVTFTAATGTTPPTITLSFPQQTVQVGGETVTLNPITLNLTGPGAPTTPLGTAIGSIAGTLNGLTAPADIAAALNGVVTSANSVLSGITATGTVSGALTLSHFSVSANGQITADASLGAQSIGTVTLTVTGSGNHLALSVGSFPITLPDLTATTSPVALSATGSENAHLQARLETLKVLLSNSSSVQAKTNALDRVLVALGATSSESSHDGDGGSSSESSHGADD
jgi:hypothetical protein